jgi:predicted alpha/beta-hydrolase family hydrolase
LTAENAARLVLADGRSVTALWTAPEQTESVWTFIYAPGAGATLEDGFGVYTAGRLASLGMATLRFVFPYVEAGRRVPDRTPVLEATWRAAIAAARGRAERLAIGGRSMGGRIASQVVAAGEAVDALALFAYPLHPPGQPERLRDAHLSRVAIPALFCSGTRDAFGTPEELERAVRLVPAGRLHLLDGADHSFRAARATGRTQKDVWAEAADSFLRWLDDVASKPKPYKRLH